MLLSKSHSSRLGWLKGWEDEKCLDPSSYIRAHITPLSLRNMYFFIGIVVVFIILSLFASRDRKLRYKRQLQALKDNWTSQKIDDFDFYHILKFNNRHTGKSYHKLSDQTISDIDFYDVFVIVDRTVTRIGQQFLFARLQRPTNNLEQLKRTDNLANTFAKDKSFREKVQELLFPLSDKDAYHVQSLLDQKMVERPAWYPFLIVSIVTIVGLLIIATKYPVAIICLLVPITVNSIVHFWNKSNTFSFLTSLPQFSTLINVCEKLNSLPDFKSEKPGEHLRALASFQRKYQFLRIGADTGGSGGDLGMIAYYLVELLKAFTLVEVFIFFSLIRELESKQESVEYLFNYVGEIDTALSVASLRQSSFKTCIPELTTSNINLTMMNGYHPMIQGCVPNSLTIDGKSILITGSNMSGKTTFLRSLMINSLLAQTLYTCFADSFRSPMVRHYSSIRIQDDVLDGKSLYFQEVSTMHALIKSSTSSEPCLFILDEVFKGTNTIERIAAAKAILSYLNKNNNIVLVATHDLELTQLLNTEYDLYHFTEEVENGALRFDHLIKPGQLKTRNAIRVLQLSNYPDEIVAEAKTISETLSKTTR